MLSRAGVGQWRWRGLSVQASDSQRCGAVAHSGVKMKLPRPPHTNSTIIILDVLPDHILLNILEWLTDHFDRQSWSLSCKHFLLLEASCRTRLSLLRPHTLPSLTRRYPHLQHLNLSSCTFLSDENLQSVAETVGKRLLSLNLAKVRTFTDVGLVVLAKECVALLDLDLSQCFQVKDLGIMAIAEIKTLQSLKLNGCRDFTDRGLVFLASRCKKLQSLGLKWCLGITDVALVAIGAHCLELRELDLSYTEITKAGLSAISKLNYLEKLSLIVCNRVDDEGLAHLRNGSKSLQTLDLSGCRSVSHKGIMGLANGAFPLQHLTLSYCVWVTDAMLHSLLRFNGLQSIRFDGCDVSGVDLGLVGKCCKNLKELSLCKCKGVTDAGLSAAVMGCSSLENIDLTCCREVTDVGLSFIARFCKGLISLKMEACSEVSEHGLQKLGDSCQCLEELDFTDSSLNDAGLKSVAKCQSLRALKLGFCTSVYDKGLFYIASNFSNLRELDFYRSLEISDTGIAAICNGCTRLKSLNLSYCTNITDTALVAVAQLRNLSILEIRGCTGVSTLGLIAVAKGCRRLVELDIKRCTSMEDFASFALAQNCKNLRQINMSYCTATDEGVVALAKLHCMQNMRLIHVKKVSIKGFSELLLAGESLKKVKLLAHLQHSLPSSLIEYVEKRGCRLRWMEKQL